MDCSSPASFVHGILQARILNSVAIPFSRGSSRSREEPSSPALHAGSVPCKPPGKIPDKTESSKSTMQTELGQVSTSIKLLSLEAQVSHHWTGTSPSGGNKQVSFSKKKSSLGPTCHPHQETESIFVIKHFNRQNKTVTSIFGHVVVRIQGRSRDFLDLSPVSYKDRQKVP